MQVDDVLDDIQAEADARSVARTRAVGLIEAVEQVGDLLGVDAAARVPDRELHIAPAG